jgi:hypothetical protein
MTSITEVTQTIRIDDEYVSNCQLMVNSHDELIEKLENQVVSSHLSKCVTLIIGPSRVGKSTILARLISKIGRDEFMSKLLESSENKDDVYTISGVNIKGGMKACTTVPNIHLSENKEIIMDLAGFSESNDGRSEVVALLNNSVFSNLSKVKFYVVVDLSYLFNPNLNFQKYVLELKKLFTEKNFKEGLKSCVFLITMVDKHGSQFLNDSDYKLVDLKKSIKYRLMELVNEYIDSPDLARFTSAISGRFVLVDHSKMDRSETLDMIEQRQVDMPILKTSDLSFNVDEIQNRLSMMAGVVISHIHRESEKLISQWKDLEKDSNDQHNTSMNKIKTIVDTVRQNRSNISIREDNIKKHQSDISYMEKEVSDCKLRVSELKEELSQNKFQLNKFKEKSGSMTLLNNSTIQSYQVGTFGKKHKVKINHLRPPGSINQTMVLIQTMDDYQKYKVSIENCSNVRSIIEHKFPYVYMNGRSNTSGDIKIDVVNRTPDLTQISIESVFEFTLMCLNDIKISDTVYSSLLTSYFEEKTESLLTSMRSQNEKMNDREMSISQNQSLIKSIRAEIKDFQSKNVEFKIIVKDDTDKHMEQISENLNTLEDLRTKLENMIKSREFLVTERLGSILLKSNINVESFREAENIRKRVDGTISELDALKLVIMDHPHDVTKELVRLGGEDDEDCEDIY